MEPKNKVWIYLSSLFYGLSSVLLFFANYFYYFNDEISVVIASICLLIMLIGFKSSYAPTSKEAGLYRCLCWVSFFICAAIGVSILLSFIFTFDNAEQICSSDIGTEMDSNYFKIYSKYKAYCIDYDSLASCLENSPRMNLLLDNGSLLFYQNIQKLMSCGAPCSEAKPFDSDTELPSCFEQISKNIWIYFLIFGSLFIIAAIIHLRAYISLKKLHRIASVSIPFSRELCTQQGLPTAPQSPATGINYANTNGNQQGQIMNTQIQQGQNNNKKPNKKNGNIQIKHEYVTPNNIFLPNNPPVYNNSNNNTNTNNMYSQSNIVPTAQQPYYYQNNLSNVQQNMNQFQNNIMNNNFQPNNMTENRLPTYSQAYNTLPNNYHDMRNNDNRNLNASAPTLRYPNIFSNK